MPLCYNLHAAALLVVVAYGDALLDFSLFSLFSLFSNYLLDLLPLFLCLHLGLCCDGVGRVHWGGYELIELNLLDGLQAAHAAEYSGIAFLLLYSFFVLEPPLLLLLPLPLLPLLLPLLHADHLLAALVLGPGRLVELFGLLGGGDSPGVVVLDVAAGDGVLVLVQLVPLLFLLLPPRLVQRLDYLQLVLEPPLFSQLL